MEERKGKYLLISPGEPGSKRKTRSLQSNRRSTCWTPTNANGLNEVRNRKPERNGRKKIENDISEKQKHHELKGRTLRRLWGQPNPGVDNQRSTRTGPDASCGIYELKAR